MLKPEKSMMTAYILWFFLCGIGVHRMYLRRPMSGLFIAVMSVVGVLMLAVGAAQETVEYLMAGATLMLAIAVWCLLDAFFIPGMVRVINEPEDGLSYVSLGAVNMDPSHSATMAGANPRQSIGSGKSALPDDYQMPWREARQKPTVVRYRSED